MITRKITKAALIAGVISPSLMVGAALAGNDVGQQNQRRLEDHAKLVTPAALHRQLGAA